MANIAALNPRIHHMLMASCKTPSLLGLPQELRDQIYDLVLTIPTDGQGRLSTVRITSSLFTGSSPLRAPSVLALLAVCRQIYNEAASIFYAQNNLRLGRTYYAESPLLTFSSAVPSPSRLFGIQRLTVPVTTLNCITATIKLAQTLPKLKTLIIEYDRSTVCCSTLVKLDATRFQAFVDSCLREAASAKFLALVAFELTFAEEPACASLCAVPMTAAPRLFALATSLERVLPHREPASSEPASSGPSHFL